MNKKIKSLLIGAGVVSATAAAGAGLIYTLSDLLFREVMAREQPHIMGKAINAISGSSITEEGINNALQRAEKLNNLEMTQVEIESFDSTKLIGHLYTAENPKRIIIAMHGWRSAWNIDFGAIVDFWHDNGCTVLFAEQRGQGASGGEYMGFGMIEHRDCFEWAKWINENGGSELPVYLAGISMGASTVLMAADDPKLPENVCGIIADCGFSSAKEELKHVLENNLHISYKPLEKEIDRLCRKRLGIDPNECTALRTLSNAKVPVFFIHGAEDHFVPAGMSYENYEVCTSPKEILIVEGADHGTSYLVDKERYEEKVKNFWNKYDKTEMRI